MANEPEDLSADSRQEIGDEVSEMAACGLQQKT